MRGWALALATVTLLAPSGVWVAGWQGDRAAAEAPQPVLHLARIQFDPPGDDDLSNASLNKEWVQIRNEGAKPWTLSGWVLRDVTGYRYTFPAGFTVAPGVTVTVHTGSGKNRPQHLYWGQGSYVWNNTGDKATLKNANGKVVDTCAYDGTGSSVVC